MQLRLVKIIAILEVIDGWDASGEAMPRRASVLGWDRELVENG
jgi:hypothetical protein